MNLSLSSGVHPYNDLFRVIPFIPGKRRRLRISKGDHDTLGIFPSESSHADEQRGISEHLMPHHKHKGCS